MTNSREQQLRSANEELLAKGNTSLIDELFAADYVAHAAGKDHTGHAFIKRWTKQLRTALPDLRVIDVTVLSEAGDRVAWQRTLSGTHTAALQGLPPSGKKVEWRDMVVSRFDGDTIAEDWVVSDLAAQLMFKLSK